MPMPFVENFTPPLTQSQLRHWVHNVFAEKVNKVKSNDDTRLQALDGVIVYPNGTGAGRVNETELLEYVK